MRNMKETEFVMKCGTGGFIDEEKRVGSDCYLCRGLPGFHI